MSRPQDPGSTGPGSTGPASTGNGHEPGLAARVRERWGVHGRGQHERDRAEARSVDLQDGARHGGARPGGGRRGEHGGGRRGEGRGGEQFVVPRAQPDSYYGKPIIKEPVWQSRDVAGYLFFGGLAGASSVLAGFAQAAGNHRQAQVSKVAAVSAIGLSGVALVADLGRPERFLNMLRVFKPSSPMSVGSWLLSGFGGASAASAACAVTGRLPKVGAAATAGAALIGPAVCTYTAALICDTAVPAWHDAHREMPYLFAGSAASAAGGLGMLALPGHAGQAARFAALGAITEMSAKSRMLRRLGETGEPYQTGRAGSLLDAAELLTAAGAAGAVLAAAGDALGGGVLGRRSRVVTALSGAALVTASALTRFGLFEAGRTSARDPKYVVRPQRERLAAKARELAP
ncbi:MAG TPA: NrfD/PsrC family molybdoenzyme membrane anchor subunit [Streptosporangiaceae bacterium]|nr:NrfD/PsrC family molybdoenzyme membrane anchor subunit [Streptosporangiaceae bacterium]